MRIKKSKKLLIVFFCAVIFFGVVKFVYDLNTDKQFTIGSLEQNNSNEVSMSYQLFNGVKEYSMALENGDKLQLDIISQGGKLDMQITEQDNEENYLYRGANIPTSSFSVQIKEPGKYRIVVNGHSHKGSYSIVNKSE